MLLCIHIIAERERESERETETERERERQRQAERERETEIETCFPKRWFCKWGPQKTKQYQNGRSGRKCVTVPKKSKNKKKQSFANYTNANRMLQNQNILICIGIVCETFVFLFFFWTVTHFRTFDFGIVWFLGDLPYKITVLGNMSLSRQRERKRKRERGRDGLRSIPSLSLSLSLFLSACLCLCLSLSPSSWMCWTWLRYSCSCPYESYQEPESHYGQIYIYTCLFPRFGVTDQACDQVIKRYSHPVKESGNGRTIQRLIANEDNQAFIKVRNLSCLFISVQT